MTDNTKTSDCNSCKYYDDNEGRGRLCSWVDQTFPPPVLRKWCLSGRVVIEIEPRDCPAFDELEKL